ncbi:hypothetical protein [Paludisphaera mucosa]|uniref:Uncharacterized protein n=1 Tax=Paludisphaera mucosa TaxID=3030827 RepID=A0ABT6FJW4_9BACT|nr:hypothetical protein [Paludisphaera mucosa]MDG3007799.1 hypothetical protein [Paludisphaera mucosa]
MHGIRTATLGTAAFLLTAMAATTPAAHAQAVFFDGAFASSTFQGYGYGVNSGAYGVTSGGYGYGPGFYNPGYYAPGVYQQQSYYNNGYYPQNGGYYGQSYYGGQGYYGGQAFSPYNGQTTRAGAVGGVIPYIPRLNPAVPTLRMR